MIFHSFLGNDLVVASVLDGHGYDWICLAIRSSRLLVQDHAVCSGGWLGR